MDILIILSPFIRVFFHLINQRVAIFSRGSFTSLVKCIPKYFILFVVIENGIVFFISLSDGSSLGHKNTIDSCVLTLHPAAPLSSSVSWMSLYSVLHRRSSLLAFPQHRNTFLGTLGEGLTDTPQIVDKQLDTVIKG